MITVTGDFGDAAGDVVTGRVWFTPTATAAHNPPDPVLVTQSVVSTTLDAGGTFTVDLIGSYDPGWLTDGTPMPYRVRWDVTGSKGDVVALIPDGGPWDLTQLVDLGVPPTFVPVPVPGPPGSSAEWVQLTQAEYDAIATPDPDTLYIIIG